MNNSDLHFTEELPPEIARSLPKFREEYGQSLLYVPKYKSVFRPVTRAELIAYEVDSVLDQVWAQITLLRKCSVHPTLDDIADNMKISDLGSLVRALLSGSGFRDPEGFERDLNQMRVLVQQRDHAVIRAICRAFPKYTPDDINAKTRGEILYLLAQAESILGYTYDGQEFAEIIKPLLAKAEGEATKGAPRRRTFSVEKDIKSINRAEYDVSDIDRPIK